MNRRKKVRQIELARKAKEAKNKFEFGEDILFEEIQDGPQEEPIQIPIEFEEPRKKA